jgi:hypothetical protein
MSDEGPWPVQDPQEGPPAAAQPEPRYQVGGVIAWSCLSAVLLIPIGFLLFIATVLLVSNVFDNLNQPPDIVSLAVPGLIVGALIPFSLWRMTKATTATSRSLWVGISIGAALFLVVFAGMCGPIVISNGWS